MTGFFTINALQSAALDYLSANLPPDCTYHNAQHTLEVCNAVMEFTQHGDWPPEEYAALRIAAIFHDFGYLTAPEANEALALPYIKKFAADGAIDDRVVERAHELILETVYPYCPITPAGELLCDADIEYIGRDCFMERAGMFRRELQLQGLEYDDVTWWNMEMDFLLRNKFFTPVCRQLREAGRQKNIAAVEKILRQFKG